MEHDGKEEFAVGKYSGKSLEEVCKSDPSYIGWILNNREIQAVEDEGGLSRIKYILKRRLKTMFETPTKDLLN